MTQIYSPVTNYVLAVRDRMQDTILPYRYPDTRIVSALNNAIAEAQRVRPDLLLDLKYQQPIQQNDLNDGYISSYYTVSDITFDSNNNYVPNKGTMVPVPSAYVDAIIWYMGADLQFLDIDDTQDQRAIAFMAKFMQRMAQPQS